VQTVEVGFDWFHQWMTSPNLKLDYLDSPANKPTAVYKEKEQTIEEIFIRVRLRNTGRRVARDCRVFLISVSEVIEGNVHKASFHDSMELAWPGYPRDFAPRPIPKGIDAYVDVVSVRKNESGWRFHIKRSFSSQPFKDYKGNYRLKILATADNAEPVELEIDVYYNQDWHSLRAATSVVKT
jgi:hypothetical protein